MRAESVLNGMQPAGVDDEMTGERIEAEVGVTGV